MELVYDRSGREEPASLCLDVLLGESEALALGVCHAVSLIKDHAGPHTPIDETLTSDSTLVVHHIQMLGPRAEVLGELPFGLASVAAPDAETAALGCLLPLVQRAKRCEEEGGVRLGLIDKTENLDGLAEAHLVAEKAAAGLKSLTIHHPLNTLELVLLVAEVVPKGCKRTHVQIERRGKSGCVFVDFLFNFTHSTKIPSGSSRTLSLLVRPQGKRTSPVGLHMPNLSKSTMATRPSGWM